MKTARRTEGDKTPEEEDTVWRRIPLDAATRRHFHLSADPFARPPESRDEVFVPPSWRRLQPVFLAAPNHQALVIAIGPSTGGKTTFLDWLFPESGNGLQMIQPRYVDRRKYNTSYLYEVALLTLDACKPGKVPGSIRRREELLEGALVKAVQEERRVALLVDDAHRLKDEDLLCLKGWVEMRANFRRLLGVILVGQEELASRLKDAGFRALRSRAQIVRWPRFERYAADFLEHRLRGIGCAYGKVFAEDAAPEVVRRIQATYHGDHEVTPAEIESCAALALRAAARASQDRVRGSLVRSLAVERMVAAIHEEEPAAAPALREATG